MNLPEIVNFMTTEEIETVPCSNHIKASIVYKGVKLTASGETTLEAICNCYTKWKNTKESSEAGMRDSSQLSLPLNSTN